jgi:hypothetical protein
VELVKQEVYLTPWDNIRYKVLWQPSIAGALHLYTFADTTFLDANGNSVKTNMAVLRPKAIILIGIQRLILESIRE